MNDFDFRVFGFVVDDVFKFRYVDFFLYDLCCDEYVEVFVLEILYGVFLLICVLFFGDEVGGDVCLVDEFFELLFVFEFFYEEYVWFFCDFGDFDKCFVVCI